MDFWQQLKKPIIGQAPMDGVTDASFRFITDKYGQPDLLFTEFTSVEGIAHGIDRLLVAFIHHKTSTPTLAQIYGFNPQLFYQATIVAAELGFNGVDINMGCPDKSVTKGGAGAGLIRDPQRAKEIILMTKKGLQDWSEGVRIDKINLHENILRFVKEYQNKYKVTNSRRVLPVSVKTRIGFDKIVTTDWIAHLLETKPSAITIHGRTLQQMYTGLADWQEIGKATQLAKGSGVLILGNGDIKTYEDAWKKIKEYNTAGVLIGRASFGNPWIFQNKQVSFAQRLDVALEHCRKFNEFTPDLYFLSLRKHLAWYCKGFDHAAETRVKLMQVNNLEEVEKIVTETKRSFL